jgi:hypothetical protein
VPLIASLRPAILDRDNAVLDAAEFAQRPDKNRSRHARRIAWSVRTRNATVWARGRQVQARDKLTAAPRLALASSRQMPRQTAVHRRLSPVNSRPPLLTSTSQQQVLAPPEHRPSRTPRLRPHRQPVFGARERTIGGLLPSQVNAAL